jgi:hypothetical protein
MDELQQLLKNLLLRRMAESLPEELQRAEKDGLARSARHLAAPRGPLLVSIC